MFKVNHKFKSELLQVYPTMNAEDNGCYFEYKDDHYLWMTPRLAVTDEGEVFGSDIWVQHYTPKGRIGTLSYEFENYSYDTIDVSDVLYDLSEFKRILKDVIDTFKIKEISRFL